MGGGIRDQFKKELAELDRYKIKPVKSVVTM